MLKTSPKTTAILNVAIFLILGSIVYVWLNKYNGIETIKILKEVYGFTILFVTVPIQVILSITPFPSEAFAFATCLLLGFWLGAVNSWIAWTIAAPLEYFLIKSVKKGVGKTSFKFPKYFEKIPVNSYLFLILGLWLPFGSHIVISTAALYNVKLSKVIISCMIGYVPLSILVSAFAHGIISFF